MTILNTFVCLQEITGETRPGPRYAIASVPGVFCFLQAAPGN